MRVRAGGFGSRPFVTDRLTRMGPDGIGMDWNGKADTERTGVDWIGLARLMWIGLDWNGLDWQG